MKPSLRYFPRKRRGYTLVELTLAIVTGMMIAAMLMSLFHQQLAFLRIFHAQSFLTTEAPIINNYLVRVIGSADGYRLYGSVEDLKNGGAQNLIDAQVLMLRFKESDGTFRAAVLSFEDTGNGVGDALYYRRVTDGAIGDPEWALSTEPADVRFSVEQGILRVRLTGPNGEQITYSGVQQL